MCIRDSGFFPRMPLDDKTEGRMERVFKLLEKYGRDSTQFGLDATVYCAGDDVDQWLRDAERWQALGATHISVQTLGQGYSSWDQHIDAVRRFMEAINA